MELIFCHLSGCLNLSFKDEHKYKMGSEKDMVMKWENRCLAQMFLKSTCGCFNGEKQHKTFHSGKKFDAL